MTNASALSRRDMLLLGSAVLVSACGPAGAKASASYFAPNAGKAYEDSPFRKLSEADWKGRLSGDAFNVLRHEDTERPFTSPLENENRQGTFVCGGCQLPLFDAKTKFHSGTGWPSFYQSLPGAVETKTDNTLGMQRV